MTEAGIQLKKNDQVPCSLSVISITPTDADDFEMEDDVVLGKLKKICFACSTKDKNAVGDRKKWKDIMTTTSLMDEPQQLILKI